MFETPPVQFASALIALLATGLVSCVLCPNSLLNSNARKTRRWVTSGVLTLMIASVIATLAHAMTSVGLVNWLPDSSFSILTVDGTPLAWTVRLDSVSLLMLTLVSFVGWVTTRFAIRYLNGEPNQGRYFRWVGFTIGAVCTMVIAGNLAMLALAWIGTSLGLHQLLTHYSDRAEAQRAALTKFVISRIGDFALIIACGIIFIQVGTLDLASLFVIFTPDADGILTAKGAAAVESGAMAWVCGLLVITAMTKSAQVPFHAWLPQTMETPTPVSALMHAGIVNAGGYLLIRTSSLLTVAPTALTILAMVGAVTACYAAIVMLTQTSVKKSLAYSTVAQMGFMMLQCGLGAFSAAMLHLLAHSVYKANAFLRSGNVLNDQAALELPGNSVSLVSTEWDPKKMGRLGLVLAAIATAYVGLSSLVGVSLTEKPGGLLLGYILTMAVTTWVATTIVHGRNLLVTGSIAAGLCLAYLAGFLTVDRFIQSDIATSDAMAAGMMAIQISVAALFTGLFFLPFLLARRPEIATVLYVHASNGFYLDVALRRIFRPLLTT